jgi:nucleoside-diphosphate-sugar epimerase
VTLLDIRDPGETGWQFGLDRFPSGDFLNFVHCDVRKEIQISDSPSAGDVIVNLAAIHREPGHRSDEYFETNLKGAENICRFAESAGCQEIMFTSSISVYGEHHSTVDEDSKPSPKTAYGQSKLQAEQIHLDWAKGTGGRLSIIRPGVVFGPGEGGNVTRLVSESLRRRRAIELVPDSAKSGIYIEELLALVHWLRQRPLNAGDYQLVNGVSAGTLFFNDYGKVLQASEHFEKNPLKVPVHLLGLGLKLAAPLKLIISTSSKVHPERLAKLTRPNDVRSVRLAEWEYPYAWPLDKAMADWLSRGI